MRKKKIDPLELASITDVLDELGIDNNNWDIIIVGDGSGTDWKNTSGWAATIVDHWGNFRAPIYGCSNTGTNQFAEIMPYIISMCWYNASTCEALIKSRVIVGHEKVRVHIVTDNQNLANQGNGQAARHAYRELWAVFDSFEAKGYEFTWHWIGRARLKLNQLADLVAGMCRVNIQNMKGPGDILLSDYLGNAIYEANPTLNPFIQPPKESEFTDDASSTRPGSVDAQ